MLHSQNIPSKRRNGLPNNGHGQPQLLLGNEAASGSGESAALLSSAEATDDDGGVSWAIEETPIAEEASNAAVSASTSDLTPAQLVANGVADCGSFKRIWAERYLCYNLGREIICLLCFCRFTQFKKFNLERHMKNKHNQLYK